MKNKMISLVKLLFETGPSAQGLRSYDERMGIKSSLDVAEENGMLNLYDELEGEREEEESPESNETIIDVSVKSTP